MAAASRRRAWGGLLTLLAGCGRGGKAAGGGAELRDELGRLVRLEREPQRIVSLMPPNTEMRTVITRSGPRLGEGVRVLAESLHPGALP